MVRPILPGSDDVAGRARLGQTWFHQLIPSVGTYYWVLLRPVLEHIPCDIHILSELVESKVEPSDDPASLTRKIKLESILE
jgi:hypothetical protein